MSCPTVLDQARMLREAKRTIQHASLRQPAPSVAPNDSGSRFAPWQRLPGRADPLARAARGRSSDRRDLCADGTRHFRASVAGVGRPRMSAADELVAVVRDIRWRQRNAGSLADAATGNFASPAEPARCFLNGRVGWGTVRQLMAAVALRAVPGAPRAARHQPRSHRAIRAAPLLVRPGPSRINSNNKARAR